MVGGAMGSERAGRRRHMVLARAGAPAGEVPERPERREGASQIGSSERLLTLQQKLQHGAISAEEHAVLLAQEVRLAELNEEVASGGSDAVVAPRGAKAAETECAIAFESGGADATCHYMPLAGKQLNGRSVYQAQSDDRLS